MKNEKSGFGRFFHSVCDEESGALTLPSPTIDVIAKINFNS